MVERLGLVATFPMMEKKVMDRLSLGRGSHGPSGGGICDGIRAENVPHAPRPRWKVWKTAGDGSHTSRLDVNMDPSPAWES